MGHPQVRYTISYLKDYFNTTDPLYVCNLIIWMLFVVIGFQLAVLIHVIILNIKNKNFKISKIPC
jgi:cytochrome c oxidase subunit IV